MADAFPVPEVWLRHRVAYGETDAMGHVYYANYLVFFERARSEFIREQGMGYAEVERRGIYLPVREAACRYRAPAYYDQLVQVRAGISAWSRASMTFAYEAWDEERATLLATGSTQHACVNGNGRPVRVPDWLREMFV